MAKDEIAKASTKVSAKVSRKVTERVSKELEEYTDNKICDTEPDFIQAKT